jgi:hypothetical protein
LGQEYADLKHHVEHYPKLFKWPLVTRLLGPGLYCSVTHIGVTQTICPSVWTPRT